MTELPSPSSFNSIERRILTAERIGLCHPVELTAEEARTLFEAAKELQRVREDEDDSNYT